LPTLLLRFI